MHIPFRISDVFNSPLDRRKIKLSVGLNAVHKQRFKNERCHPPSYFLYFMIAEEGRAVFHQRRPLS
jgi:hypothetical protein